MERNPVLEQQEQSAISTINELGTLGIQLLGIIRETRHLNPGEDEQGIHATHGLKDSLNRIHTEIRASLKRQQPVTNDRGLSRLLHACETIAGDILVRLEVVEKDATRQACSTSAELWEKAWSDESLVALENHISWIIAETLPGKLEIARNGQNLSNEVMTAGSQPEDSKSTGSRRLWTGPLQQRRQLPGSEKIASKGSSLPGTLSNAGNESPDLVADVERSLLNRDKAELLQEFVLESLTFTSMNDREEEVSEAHYQTFEWIFAATTEPRGDAQKLRILEGDNNFVSWLVHNDAGRIYWVNGKAGSGKSTLMRFIANHNETREHLKRWAGAMPLTMVNFFFWTSGSVLQRSQTGLLRSLLCQLLDQQRDLIPWAFPELWLVCQDTKKRVEMMLSWEQAELLSGLRRSLQLASKRAKICLFIDGLDEFEGDEDVIIGLVRDIVELSENIKACISSRPWAAFENAFEDVPHILLQDLTLADMDKYVSDRVKENVLTRRIVRKAPDQFQQFKSEMMSRADGVFLWTSLALRTVISTIQGDSSVSDLQNRLFELPSDLEDLFRHLLFNSRSIETLSDQSQILQLIRARDEVCDFTGDDSVRSISLYQTALAHQGDAVSIGRPICQCDKKEVMALCRNFADLLENACSNLLILTNQDKVYARTHTRFHEPNQETDVHAEANRRIHYLHRTVRDFFASSGVWTEIVANGPPSFDPHTSLLLSHVQRLRSPLHEPEQHRRLDEWWHDDVVLAMSHARYASAETAKAQVTLLDQLNATLHWYWRKKPSDPLDTWARHAFGTYEERMKHRTPFHHPFLSLAAKFGLGNYLRNKLATTDFSYKGGIPMLSHAVEFLVDRRKTVYPLSDPTVIAALLDTGASPNQQYHDLQGMKSTPWLLALKYIREGDRRHWMRPFDVDPQGIKRWVKVLEQMMDHGADPNAVIVKDAWDPEATPLSIISAVALKYFSSDIYGLKTRLDEASRQGAQGEAT